MPYKIQIYIDYREDAIRHWLAKLPARDNITFKELPAGDIVFLVEEEDEDEKKILTPFCVWERKALDLCNVPHFREQRSRLIDWRKDNPDLVVALLIEGDLNTLLTTAFGEDKAKKRELENLVNDLCPKYNIGRITSANTVDTIRLIGRYENIFKEDGPTAKILESDSVVRHLSLGRKRGLVQKEWAICALSFVKGVSRETAMDIGKTFTLKTLFEAYRRCRSTKECDNLIRNLDIGVGLTRSRRIYHYMMDIEDEPADDIAEQSSGEIEIVASMDAPNPAKKAPGKGKGQSKTPKRKTPG